MALEEYAQPSIGAALISMREASDMRLAGWRGCEAMFGVVASQQQKKGLRRHPDLDPSLVLAVSDQRRGAGGHGKEEACSGGGGQSMMLCMDAPCLFVYVRAFGLDQSGTRARDKQAPLDGDLTGGDFSQSVAWGGRLGLGPSQWPSTTSRAP